MEGTIADNVEKSPAGTSKMHLINLEILNLRLNQLKTLPDTIGRLSSLKETREKRAFL